MSLQNKLLHLFPDYADGDWRLQDDGAGPYIAEWNRQDAQPAQAVIDAVTNTEADDAEETVTLKRSFELTKKDKALVLWIADLHGLTVAQARQQLRAIWRSLP